MARDTADRAIADGRIWKKVRAPQPWRPTMPNDEIIGEYIGRSIRSGKTGSYTVVTLKTADGPVTIAGVVVATLFDASESRGGDLVRIVYKGDQISGAGNMYRDYEMFVLANPEEYESSR